MNKNLTKVAEGILLGSVLLAILAACGGSTAGNAPTPTTTQATATSGPTPTLVPAATATAVITPTVVPTATVNVGSGDLLARGKSLYEETAGGLGCAYCHGLSGRGDGSADVNAANIRGLGEPQIRAALGGGVAMMGFIELSDDEITAVAVYLQYLATQP